MKIAKENNFTVTLGSSLRVSNCSLKGSKTRLKNIHKNQQFDNMYIIKTATPASQQVIQVT